MYVRDRVCELSSNALLCHSRVRINNVGRVDDIPGLVHRKRQGSVMLLLYAMNRARATYLVMTFLLRSGPPEAV